MAKKIRELVKRLEAGYKAQGKELDKLVEANAKLILDLNKQQLFAGQNADGKSLGTYKSTWYAKFKKMLNPQGVVDLFLTGRFYSKFFLKRKGFPIKIDSTDEKRDKLVSDWGANLFGLNEESQKILARDIFKVGLGKYWRKIIHRFSKG